uniref:Uncharacterized protein n=1 Tax=Pipistrellus kuhlii TaxID=59472 RepID=A0A7J7ZIW0_PIPKU|nr:hypothetical protein mPipKuh1_009433 [Pipistrellus kuhlii]
MMHTDHQGEDTQHRSYPLVISALPQWSVAQLTDRHKTQSSWLASAAGSVSLACGHTPACLKRRLWQAQWGWDELEWRSTQLGLGSSPGACPFTNDFMLCRTDANSRLKPNMLVGKAGLWRHGGALIPTGQAERPHQGTNLHWASICGYMEMSFVFEDAANDIVPIDLHWTEKIILKNWQSFLSWIHMMGSVVNDLLLFQG